MSGITVVVQGQVYKWTPEFLWGYACQSIVKKIIFSCWDSDDINLGGYRHSKISILHNRKPANAGIGNRNYQIESSFGGIAHAINDRCTKYILKVRSDMLLPDLDKVMEFALTHKKQHRLFVLGMYPLVFHPRDHVFFGKSSDLFDLFTIPLDTVPTKHYDEKNDVRSEAYIGAHYYARHDARVRRFLENPKDFLTDNSPKVNEAKLVYDQLRHDYFFPLPRSTIVHWPKHYPNGYPYDWSKAHYGEYWFEDIKDAV